MTTTTNTALTVGDTARLAAGFYRPAEADLRLTVTTIDGGAISGTVQGSGKLLTLAAQALEPAECVHCRYTRGHTSWCPNGDGSPLVTDAERAAVDASIAAGRFTLLDIAVAANDDVTLNANLVVTTLGGGIMALNDLANGLVITLNEGADSIDTDRDGLALLEVGHEDDPEQLVASREVRTVAEVLEVLGGIVGRG